MEMAPAAVKGQAIRSALPPMFIKGHILQGSAGSGCGTASTRRSALLGVRQAGSSRTASTVGHLALPGGLAPPPPARRYLLGWRVAGRQVWDACMILTLIFPVSSVGSGTVASVRVA